MNILLLAALLFAQGANPARIPAGTVEGRILAADGLPAAEVRVSAMAIPDSPGDPQILEAVTETDGMGRYLLSGLSPGRYYIIAGFVDAPTYYPGVRGTSGATAVEIQSGAALTNIDFRVLRSSTGFTVSGRLSRPSGESPGMTVQVALNGEQFSNTMTRLDGTFAFPEVRAGSYMLSINAGAGMLQQRSVAVIDEDVTGLDMVIPWTVDVEARLVVDGEGPLPVIYLTFSGGDPGRASSSGGQRSPVLQLTPAGRMSLAEGIYGVSVGGIASGYYLKSMTADGVNLLEEALTLSRNEPLPEIVVTLGITSPQPWVRLRGRIAGFESASAGAQLTLAGQGGSVSAAVAADGTFEFPKVLPGSYTASINLPQAGLPQYTIVAPNRDLEGIELQMHPVRQLSGRIVVENGGPLPRLSFMAMPIADSTDSTDSSDSTDSLAPQPDAATVSPASLFVTRMNGSTGTRQLGVNPRPDGAFTVTLPQGSYRIAPDLNRSGGGLGNPYVIRSFRYGDVDLLQSPLEIGAAASTELRLTLAAPSPMVPAPVRGRVLGWDAGNAASVNLIDPRFVSNLTAAVYADGSFEFPSVYPGNYTVTLPTPVGPVTASVRVANSPVDGVELVLPAQKEISGRVIVEGGAPIPRFNLPLVSVTSMAGFAVSAGSQLSIQVNPQPDGTFNITLPEGERLVGTPNGLPPGYGLKALAYGAVDLMSQPLKVAVADTAGLLVTLSAPAFKPVSVSGRVEGLDAAELAQGTTVVSISAPEFVETRSAVVGADGSFLFSAVFPGNYTAALTSPSPNARTVRAAIRVRSDDIEDVRMVVPRPVVLGGIITVSDSVPIPRRFTVVYSAAGGQGPMQSATGISAISDGTFQVTLPAGEYRIGASQIPAGYIVKSFTYGTVDVLSSSIHIDAADLQELRIEFSAPGIRPVSVSGRVEGIDASVLALGSTIVRLNSPAYWESWIAMVRSDGSFELPSVYSGDYMAVLESPGVLRPVDQVRMPLTVGNTDVRDILLAAPRHIAISGRIVVEGGGRIPGRMALNRRGVPASYTVSPRSDGAFQVTLPEGEHFIDIPAPALAGYRLKSMTYGPADLQQAPLKVESGASGELVIVLESAP